MVSELPYIDASKASLLLQCRRRWRKESAPSLVASNPPAGRGEPKNLGTLAHEAVQDWVEHGEWRSKDPGRSLQLMFDQRVPSDPATVGLARRLSAGLAIRGRALAQVLATGEGDPGCEVPTLDKERRLRGKIDLVTQTAGSVHVIDLKTGSGFGTGSDVPLSAKCQMAVYSVLAQQKWNKEVRLSIFSMESGLQDIALTDTETNELVEQLEAERLLALVQNPLATPAASACTWCSFRSDCYAHWEAVANNDIQDATRGCIVSIQLSESGVGSAVLADSTAICVVTDLREEQLSGFRHGDYVALYRLRQPRVEGAEVLWRATTATRIEYADSAVIT